MMHFLKISPFIGRQFEQTYTEKSKKPKYQDLKAHSPPPITNEYTEYYLTENPYIKTVSFVPFLRQRAQRYRQDTKTLIMSIWKSKKVLN